VSYNFRKYLGSCILLFLFIHNTQALTYHVKQNDTLYGLSLKYGVPVNWIIRANNLDSELIKPGEELVIPTGGITEITVKKGDTLSSIAQEFNISVSDLKIINNLENDIIHQGDKLAVVPQRPGTITVKKGDSLWSISRKFGVSIEELKLWNSLEKEIIQPGNKLVLYPDGDKIQKDPDNSQTPDTDIKINLASAHSAVPENILSESNNEYYYSIPEKKYQPDTSYCENPHESLETSYNRAMELIKKFDDRIKNEKPLGRELYGWKIIIDPGHGGYDPGSIVSVPDGNGNPVVITEDEYASDISYRLYRILKLHGASVDMTVLAPDHLIRDGSGPRETFVHRKNEVYNISPEIVDWRPVGTKEGLDVRKTIASGKIKLLSSNQQKDKTLFISIHNDYSPDLPEGRAVLFDGADQNEINASKALAEVISQHMGKGSFTRHQELRVLRNNPAACAVLIEARNIFYKKNAWALRLSELREQDAEMIADGIIDWAEQHN